MRYRTFEKYVNSVNPENPLSDHIRRRVKRMEQETHLYKALKGLNRSFVDRFNDWVDKLELDAKSKIKQSSESDSEKASSMAYNTMRTYVNRSIYFLEFLKTYEKHPFEFEPSDALNFQMYLQNLPQTFLARTMSGRYVNMILDAVRNMYDYFLIIGVGIKIEDNGKTIVKKLPNNPFKIIPNLAQNVETKERMLSKDEIEEIFDTAQGKHYVIAMLLGLNAGLRISEVVNVKKEDISEREFNGQDVLVISVYGKGMKSRDSIYIDRDTTQDILDYSNGLPDGSKLVPVSMHNMLKFCNRLGKKLSFDGFSFHRFRHTFGYRLAERKIPIETIGKLMGHSSLDTTRIYSRVTTDRAISEIFK